MAVSTAISTPLTLKIDQALTLAEDKNIINCFNDSGLSQLHYRTIPKDNSIEGLIRWANLPSVLLPDGDYAVAVSMAEYIYTGGGFASIILLQALPQKANTGELYTDPEDRKYVIQKDTVKDENPRITFRKIVWVKATDLFLGSVAQKNAIDIEAEKKRQQELIDLANPKKDPITGNVGGNTGSSTTTWIIVAIVFVFIAGIWVLISILSKKRKKQQEIEKSNASQVNVIRIPKNT